MSRPILDEEYHDSIEGRLKQKEKIILDLHPIFEFGSNWKVAIIWFLTGNKVTTLAAIFSVIFIRSIIQKEYGVFILSLFIFLSIRFIYSALFYNKIKNTRYVVTDQRIIFQNWKWGKIKITSVYLKNLKDCNYTLLPNATNGTIFLLPKDMKDIEEALFTDMLGENQTLPALELIENVEEVTEKMRTVIKEQQS